MTGHVFYGCVQDQETFLKILSSFGEVSPGGIPGGFDIKTPEGGILRAEITDDNPDGSIYVVVDED